MEANMPRIDAIYCITNFLNWIFHFTWLYWAARWYIHKQEEPVYHLHIAYCIHYVYRLANILNIWAPLYGVSAVRATGMAYSVQEWESREFLIVENIRLVCRIDLTADFGVKTNAKFTPKYKLREKSKIGILSCLYTVTLSSDSYLSWRTFSDVQFLWGKGVMML